MRHSDTERQSYSERQETEIKRVIQTFRQTDRQTQFV